MPKTVSLCELLQRPNLIVPLVEFGGTIASEGKGEYMYVEGRVLTTEGEPIADAVIETWEADKNGMTATARIPICSCYHALTVTTRVLRYTIYRQSPPRLSWTIAYHQRWQLWVSRHCSPRISHSG